MATPKTKKLKTTLSWTVGLPAAIVAMSEVTDLDYFWVQVMAICALVAIMRINGLLDRSLITKGYFQ